LYIYNYLYIHIFSIDYQKHDIIKNIIISLIGSTIFFPIILGAIYVILYLIYN